jgi:CRISPR type III-B/RAMP module RAMP protein Cmr1
MPVEIFPLEVLTSTFVAGANPRGNKQAIKREGIRVPAVAAGLRWWFRALAGGILGSEQIPRIHAAESLIFGSTFCSSRVRLSIAPPTMAGWKAEQFSAVDDRAVAYLAYGMEKTRKQVGRCFLPAGNPFSLSVRISPPRSDTEPAISPALIQALVRMWVSFSGLGGRWRHGLGGLGFRSETPPALSDLPRTVASELREASRLVSEFLAAAGPVLAQVLKRQESSIEPLFPVVAPGSLFVKVGKRDFATARDALRFIKDSWRRHRQEDPGNPRSASKNAELYKEYLYFNDDPPPEPELLYAGLGLPIPFQFRGDEDHKGSAKPTGDVRRRASPIWLRVRRITPDRPTGGSWSIVAMYWRAVYLPAGTGVELTGGHQNWPVSYNPIEAKEWFDRKLPASGWTSVDFSAPTATDPRPHIDPPIRPS